MIIANAKYLTNIGGDNIEISCTIDTIPTTVPMDPANRHYAAILEWVEDGNTIEDAD